MDLLDTFPRESEELIADFEAGLVALENTTTDPAETVAALFRAAHTLKGSAGMVGLSGFVQFAHVLEHVLGRVREGTQPIDAGVVDALLASADVMRAMVAAAAQGQTVEAVAGWSDTRREVTKCDARLRSARGRHVEASPDVRVGDDQRGLPTSPRSRQERLPRGARCRPGRAGLCCVGGRERQPRVASSR
jgi:two-component system chemotaxis sensor kinase CheA